MVCPTLMFINPPDLLKFNHKASGHGKIKKSEKKIYQLIKMSHFPYRKRRKNLLTADKTKATKTKTQQLQTTSFSVFCVCVEGGVGALQWAMEYSSNCWWVQWVVHGGAACGVQGGGAQITADRGQENAERRWRLATIASTLALMNMSTLYQSETRVFHGPSPLFHSISGLIPRRHNELMWLLPARWLWWVPVESRWEKRRRRSTTRPQFVREAKERTKSILAFNNMKIIEAITKSNIHEWQSEGTINTINHIVVTLWPRPLVRELLYKWKKRSCEQ